MESSLSLIDSHCHLHHIDLAQFNDSLDDLMAQAEAYGVSKMLCVCIDLNDLEALHQLAERYSNLYTSIGIHPNSEVEYEPTAEDLIKLGAHPSCIATGETGLDYFRTVEEDSKESQRLRFRRHIRAAIASNKPLIIHTRDAAADTLRLMKEEKASDAGGVIHCFTETWDVARQALDLGFFISFSGIVSFKNATQLHEVAKKVPLDKLLIETDAPYLAPVPYRGKQNHPALVKYVAKALSELRNEPLETIARISSENFYQCFKVL